MLFKVVQNIGKKGKFLKSLINIPLIAKSNQRTPKRKPSSYWNVVSKSPESPMTLPGSLDGQNYFHNNPMTLSLWPCWHLHWWWKPCWPLSTNTTNCILHSYALELKKNKPVSLKSILEERLLILLNLKPWAWSLIFCVRKMEGWIKKFGCSQSTSLFRGKGLAWLNWELNLTIFFMENVSYL